MLPAHVQCGASVKCSDCGQQPGAKAKACLHVLPAFYQCLLSTAVRGVRQLAPTGDPAPRDTEASTAPWATCSAVSALYVSLFTASCRPKTPPEEAAPCSMHEALVRVLGMVPRLQLAAHLRVT